MRGIIDILIDRNCFRINLVITFLVCKIEMRSSIRRSITTAATNSISTFNWSLSVPIATQKKRYFTTQEQPAHSTYSVLAKTMEISLKDITSASLGIYIYIYMFAFINN